MSFLPRAARARRNECAKDPVRPARRGRSSSCSRASEGSVSVSRPLAGRSSGPTSGSPRPRLSTRSTATSAISGRGVHVNEDINVVLDQIAAGEREPIPDHDLLVGGFPCQDYSVAKTLNQAHGIEGKKGVLWWSIYRILEEKRPRLVFLENVDRLLKSPATQRGRDFAIILACLSDLGYLVEWRVVNAADYGFPQRRRRVFIVAHTILKADEPDWDGPIPWLLEDGALAAALPVRAEDASVVSLEGADVPTLELKGHPAQITQEFGWGRASTPFRVGGVMWNRKVWTRDS